MNKNTIETRAIIITIAKIYYLHNNTSQRYFYNSDPVLSSSYVRQLYEFSLCYYN